MFTKEQNAKLREYIQANQELIAKTTGKDTDFAGIAEFLSAYADPVQLAWRKSVSPNDIDDVPDYEAFDAVDPGKRDSWGYLLRRERDFSRAKTRAWVVAIWGPADSGTNSEAILLAATEPARNVEVVLGLTVKPTGAVEALERTYAGEVGVFDVAEIFGKK